MPEKEYIKLPGTRRKVSLAVRETHTLWMAADHLLMVVKTYYTENYKRFYFKDIQGISIQKTRNGFWSNIICAGFIFFLTFSSWLFGQMVLKEPSFIFLGAGLSTPFLIYLIINTILGPTCQCMLKTAVHMEELHSLNRLRRAHRVLNERLSPKIIETQGTLSPEDLSSYYPWILENH